MTTLTTIGRCEAYDFIGVHECGHDGIDLEKDIVRCKRSGQAIPLANTDEKWILCDKHADMDQLLLPDAEKR